MEFNARRTALVAMAGAICTIAFFVFQFFQIETPRAVSAEEAQLAKAIATVPIGSSPVDVRNRIGVQPDSVSTNDAILANSSSMFTATSKQGQLIGEPQTFTFHRWKRGDLNVSVAFASDDTVAAKLVWLDD